jgi:hypothetical protein
MLLLAMNRPLTTTEVVAVTCTVFTCFQAELLACKQMLHVHNVTAMTHLQPLHNIGCCACCIQYTGHVGD